jgi:DNA polymerase-3 subunit epsilon
MSLGILHLPISETPIAILGLETTGLSPGYDRIVEVAVVRCDPGSEPKLVFDTLVNPQRPMSATEIHGITDKDVTDAPKFQDIAEELLATVSGCVIAVYNAFFNMRFFDFEIQCTRVSHSPPHICLMYLRPLLGLGNRCSLLDACNIYHIPLANSHLASSDAIASAKLLNIYYDFMQKQGIQTFGDLSSRGSYKFLNSFLFDPIIVSAGSNFSLHNKLRSRIAPKKNDSIKDVAKEEQKARIDLNRALALYWDALKTVITDLSITDQELEYMHKLHQSSGLKKEHIRYMHARAFAAIISQFIEDRRMDDGECLKLKKLHQCLSALGWAPGE